MNRLWLKLKIFKFKISWWNKNILKKISNVVDRKNNVISLENDFLNDPSDENLKLLSESKELI